MPNQKPKLYRNVFTGSEVIDSLVTSGMVASRDEALALGNRLASELKLFSRANNNTHSGPSSPQGHQSWPKGKARANLLAAQTILLGTNETSQLHTSDPTDDHASCNGCFTDDINAFFRFGPGVLTILRDIDQINTSNDEKPERSLSIVPNAPGCGGKTALEDLFSVRDPKAKPSKLGKKSTNKHATAEGAESKNIPTPNPRPYPKSILKNGTNYNKNNKIKKKKKNKTKKSKAHKIKAGAKIKYISGKERRVRSIEKRLSICHSEQQVRLYRKMLRELEARLSRMYTGDHKVVASYSPPSTPVADKERRNEQLIASSTKHGISLSGPLNVKNSELDFSDNDDDRFEEAIDDAFDSLDNIISKNSDLLADGDDNISVWTEFILGTSGIVAATPMPNKTKAKPRAHKKETHSPSERPKEETTKALKDVPYKEVCDVSEVDESAELETNHHPDEHSDQLQKSNKTPANGWQAPAPLESGGGRRGKKTKKGRGCDGNEIDLSDWALVNRDNEGGEPGKKKEDHHPDHSDRYSPPQLPFDAESNGHKTKSRTVPLKNHLRDVVANDDIPDDISLMLAQEQERQSKAIRIHDLDDGVDISKKHDIAKENRRRLYEEHKKTNNAFSTPEAYLGRPVSFTESMNGSFRSDLTKDSVELARLRMVPNRKGFRNNRRPEDEIDHENPVSCRNYNRSDSDRRGDADDSLDSSPPTESISDPCRASDETDSTNSGIMEAIERDPFYQLAAAPAEEKTEPRNNKTTTTDKKRVKADPPDSSPSELENKNDLSGSEPGSFTDSYMDSYFDDSCDEFDEEEDTYDTYSDEDSYMELTVNDDEEESDFEDIEEEVVEEVLEDDEIFFEEIPIVSQSDRNINYNQYHKNVSPPTPILSPRRRMNKFQSARYLPPVPELGPEPEPEPQPKPASPKRDESVYIDVYSMDDDMTQITMEGFSYRSTRSLHVIPEDDYTINMDGYTNQNSYLFDNGEPAVVSPIGYGGSKRTINNAVSQLIPPPTNDRRQSHNQRAKKSPANPSSKNRGGKTVLPTETSHQRIQEILWKDLSNTDVTVVWSALEELRILVATESRSRAYLIRNGGAMVVIDTMADQLEVEVVQFLCCNILNQLASLDAETGLTIHELGGSTLIKQAIKKHAGSRRIKEMGETALATLSHYS